MLRSAYKPVRFYGSSRFFSSLNTGSVNEEEVAKFSAVGKDWWDKSSSTGTGPLHAMNPIRVGYIRSHLAAENSTLHLFESQQLKGMSILDVGCGGGLLAESLSRLGANVTAIDPSEQNIKVASSHSKTDRLTSSINYRVATIDQIYESNEKFDAVCSLEVIEHVENPEMFMRACAGCVRPGGSLFISTMNKTPKAYLIAILAAEYLLGMVPPGTHDWNKFITPSALKKMVEFRESEPPMQVKNMSGMVLEPDAKLLLGAQGTAPVRGLKWALSSSDLDVNYILHAVRPPQ